MNKTLLTGRLTADPELRSTSSGASVCSFTVAVDNIVTKDGKSEKEASFINCVAWSSSANFLGNYCKKGNLIAIDGHLQTRSYDRKDGTKAYVTEVIVDRVENLTPRETTNNTQSEPEVNDDDIKTFDDIMDDDDLPF